MVVSAFVRNFYGQDRHIDEEALSAAVLYCRRGPGGKTPQLIYCLVVLYQV